jgi:hypothetical protein
VVGTSQSQATPAHHVLRGPPVVTTGGRGLAFPVPANPYANSSRASGSGSGGGGGRGSGQVPVTNPYANSSRASGRGSGGGRGRGSGGSQGSNETLTVQRMSQEVINAGSRSVVGYTESTGEERRFWSDDKTDGVIKKNEWRCGEIMKDSSGRPMFDEDNKIVTRGGCGMINLNYGWYNFMCKGCGEGKSGYKQDEGAQDSNKNSSFSCDCGKCTFHGPSERLGKCFACNKERGAFHRIYGHNRGWIKNPRTRKMDVYLGFFGEPGKEVEKWKSENPNFKRRKR